MASSCIGSPAGKRVPLVASGGHSDCAQIGHKSEVLQDQRLLYRCREPIDESCPSDCCSTASSIYDAASKRIGEMEVGQVCTWDGQIHCLASFPKAVLAIFTVVYRCWPCNLY
jgi:hypothetical protein